MTSKNERIKNGDYVNVFWEHCEPLRNVRVVHVPTEIGDSWHLYSEETGIAHAAILYSRMDRVLEGKISTKNTIQALKWKGGKE